MIAKRDLRDAKYITNLMIHFSYALPAAAVLKEYTRVRVPDDHAIADLAMYNYVEVGHQLNVCCNRLLYLNTRCCHFLQSYDFPHDLHLFSSSLVHLTIDDRLIVVSYQSTARAIRELNRFVVKQVCLSELLRKAVLVFCSLSNTHTLQNKHTLTQ